MLGANSRAWNEDDVAEWLAKRAGVVKGPLVAERLKRQAIKASVPALPDEGA